MAVLSMLGWHRKHWSPIQLNCKWWAEISGKTQIRFNTHTFSYLAFLWLPTSSIWPKIVVKIAGERVSGKIFIFINYQVIFQTDHFFCLLNYHNESSTSDSDWHWHSLTLMDLCLYDFMWYITYTSISNKKFSLFRKKTMETRIKKTFSIKMRCKDVKTQKASEQGREANIGPKIKQTTYI